MRFMRATQDDLVEIVAIYNAAIPTRQSTADLSPVSIDERQAWFDAHSDNRPLYVLKNEQNQVVAWGSFSDYYPRAAYDITAEISLYVDPKYQGQKLGTLMLSNMLQQTDKLGIQNVIAVIFAHNQASIQLFKSVGFNQWGYLPQVCDLGTFMADIVLLGKTFSA